MIVARDIDKFFKNFFRSSMAQAFLLVGDDGETENLLIRYLACDNKNFCKKCLQCQSESFLGIRFYEGESLKIEDAREIQFAASQSALYGPKIFRIKTVYIAADAQATLLKTIEEPYPETYFIISLVSEASLSAPLLSRLTIFKKSRRDEVVGASKFKLNLENISSIAQNREEAEEVFREIEAWMESRIRVIHPESAISFSGFVEDYFEIKKRFFEKTYPPKMLLEHLAVSKYYFE
ncbi:hypothetical protein A3I27_02165 [Candidatus Giovannonibacteria bacterium RIFCSPLOWO2_02_FULL_43_11b]|uniref:DNA polymerase III subunit delta n=1 Tax=Candidatus Giovannonibacteria bacterium RIFCSPHIGHO2_12_FULL_43_15 TaxID=1798341 RepID=A0A1F5WQ63_9BACT|nr:MAG: hypothetical protein A2739_02550 [Candidatus Giovannonibacteria bacterium RIFCSPHIGHO2_01_FULL_43_100]OGF67301.1 MAG: hypothetical protein A3B97_03260 [Candidatus Giovannonibacteria bacterium RIFCSPHIGHO2_02_FULL_43_32]OGF77789.1 MAG: hypothetical protein A3F23_04135 [Candidatus Giovannonibacteria bacterium RIFCSPHIGHO2_12_FULL_43_15]OGF78582.1 MAG: hypothetical protein A3A15_01320 [Candidatus Giovannonibacteria bacterium RIFCSPLOWO2_01_FULL_43_60]OGF90019.1 MAG: hypothetical protein A3